MPVVIYVVDTSSLVNVQRTYPRAVFPGLWQQLTGLAGSGRLISTREVFNELKEGADDEILGWAKAQKSMFQDPDDEQIAVAREIVNDPRFGQLFDIDAEMPEADPFVIALAFRLQRRDAMSLTEYVVVADEARAKPGKKPKIPNVCAEYGLECIGILEMCLREGWEFVSRTP
jgi:hypothetical protein